MTLTYKDPPAILDDWYKEAEKIRLRSPRGRHFLIKKNYAKLRAEQYRRRSYWRVVARLSSNADAFTFGSVRVTPNENTLEHRFKEQADKWQRETEHLSSPTQRIMHPSYQAILGMGNKVVPILLRDLQQNRRPWFWALSYLTQENPINPKDTGRMDRMIEAWVRWGKEKDML